MTMTPHRPGRLTPAVTVGLMVAFLIVALSASVKTLLSPNLDGITASLGGSHQSAALGPTLFMVFYGLASPGVGAASDRFGAQRVMTYGLLACAVGLVLCGFAGDPWQFALTYGFICGVGFAAVSYVPIGIFVQERVPERYRSTAFAVLSNGTAIGFIVLTPLWVGLADTVSWRPVFITVGAGLVVVAVLASRLLGRSGGADADGPEEASEVVPRVGWAPALRIMVGNRTYVVFVLSFISCGLSMGLIDVHVIGALHEHGMDTPAVGVAVALLGVFELVVGVAAGRWVDRGKLHATSGLCYAVRAVALVALLVGGGDITGFAFTVLFGASYMGTVVSATRAVTDSLPAPVAGLGLGVMWLLHQVGAAVSSQAGAWAIDNDGSLSPVIAAIAVACAVSAVATASPRVAPVRARTG